MSAKIQGAPDQSEIGFLITRSQHPERGAYIVFVDKDLDLDWWIDDAAHRILDEPLNRKTLNEIAKIEPLVQNWPSDIKTMTKRLLGGALACAIENDASGANEALENARQYYANKSKQVSRYWMLLAFLVGGSLAIALAVASLLAASWLVAYVGPTAYILTLCFFSGCVGAVLFSLLRFRRPSTDATSERRLHFCEAAARLAAGGISGVLVGSVVKLGLFLPVFASTGKESLAMCSVALIAGASERLAAGIVTSTEASLSSSEVAHGSENQ